VITSETALLDTNVLLYAADGTSAFHQSSKHLRDSGIHVLAPVRKGAKMAGQKWTTSML